MPIPRLTRAAAEAFLVEEARLLDEGRLEEWLALFTEDGAYWLPLGDGGDPTREPSIVYDDRRQLAQRVYQLLHTPRYAQRPPSRTLHYVTNVEVDDDGSDTEAEVRCNVLVAELRPGAQRQAGLGEPRVLAARCVYRLRAADVWRIARKTVFLLDRERPLQNLTFLL